jgi:2'-5' RNA ligase
VTRAFVAVTPPERVLDAVAASTSPLVLPDARRTTRDQWHVTLQFLGNRAEIDAVAPALAGVTTAPGVARLGGAGAFPSARRARVVWIGCSEGRDLLTALAAEVARLLEPLGYAPEQRAFHPHLTLARCRAPADVRGALSDLESCDYGPAWTVSEVVLYESRLRRDGAQYIARDRIRLST